MAKSAYIGVSSKAKKVKKIYIGQNGVAKKVKKAYIGDANGKAKLFFSSGGVFYYGMGSSSYTSGTYNAENNSFYRVQEWKNDGKIDQITVTSIISWRASAIWFWNNCWVWVTKRTNYEPYLNIMDKDSFAVTQLTLSGSSTIGIGFANGMVAGFVVDGNKAYMLFVNTGSASRGYFININLANLTYTVTDTNKTNFVAQYDANKSNSLSMLPNGKLLMNHTGYGNGLYVYDQTNNTMTKVTTSGSAAQGFCIFYERAKASNRVCINIAQYAAITDGSSITISSHFTSTYDKQQIIWCQNEFLHIYNNYAYVSSDGISWTTISSNTGTFGLRALGYGDGVYLGIGTVQGSSSDALYWKSTDRINWTAIAPSGSYVFSDYMDGTVTYSDNNGIGN